MSQEWYWRPVTDHGCTICEELLTADELAARLKVPKRWVYTNSQQGLPTIKVGHYSRFLFSDVLRYLRCRSGSPE